MKRLVAVVGVVSMFLLAGCMGGVVSEEALSEDATYDWDTTETVSVDLSGPSYQAVYTIENRSSVELYHHGDLGGEEAIPIRAIKFRYPNGTVVNASAMAVSEENSRTVVEFPVRDGMFAYSAESASGNLFFPVVVDGSHEVILPEGARIAVPIIGAAEPTDFEKTFEEDRVQLVWDSPERDVITVSYYLERDLYIFGGLIGLLVLVAGGGLVYFRYQLRRLQSDREETGLDVEE